MFLQCLKINAEFQTANPNQFNQYRLIWNLLVQLATQRDAFSLRHNFFVLAGARQV